jgi:hypothetical protein
VTALTRDIAEKFASLALAHVSREYPNIMQHVLVSDADAVTPRKAHPIFFGSYDWHSCVHGYWLMARLMRRFPGFATAKQISALFDERITAENVAGELAYISTPHSRGFERPYGWGWLLALQAELDQHTDGAGKRAAETLRPLAEAFAARFSAFLPLADYPVRRAEGSRPLRADARQGAGLVWRRSRRAGLGAEPGRFSFTDSHGS